MQKASMTAKAMGIYTLELNGKRVEDAYWVRPQDACFGWLREEKTGYRKGYAIGGVHTFSCKI